MRLLWLEDEDQVVRNLQPKLESDLKIPAARITHCKHAGSAMAEFKRAASTDPYTHALIDLTLEEQGPTKHQGFEFLEGIRRTSKTCTAVILSNFIDDDEALETKGLLEARGIAADEVINKRYSRHIPALLRPYLLCVDDVLTRLERSKMCASSLVMESLVRTLRVFLEELPDEVEEKLPSLLIRGEYGSGKTFITEALPLIAPEAFVEEEALEQLNAALLAPDGEGARMGLMGARNFAHVADCAGLFERATRYHQCPNLATPKSSPIGWPRKIAFVDEVQALHNRRELSEYFLKLMENSLISPAGGGPDLRVHCLFVGATRLSAEEAATYEDARPFYERFRKTVTVPPVWDRGDEWLRILRWCVAKHCKCDPAMVEIDKGAENLACECVMEDNLFNTRQLGRIAEQIRGRNPIVTLAMVQEVERQERAKGLERGSSSGTKCVVITPMAPPTSRKEIDVASAESPSELAASMAQALEGISAKSKVPFRSWLDGDPALFTESTAQFRDEHWRLWADACLLLAFKIGDKGFTKRFEVIQSKAGPRPNWRWRDVINPCVLGHHEDHLATSVSNWLKGYPFKLENGKTAPQKGKNLAFVEKALVALAKRHEDLEDENERASRELALRLYGPTAPPLKRRAASTWGQRESKSSDR